MLSDRGGQFVDPTGTAQTHFEEVLEALGIGLRIALHAHTEGKEERLNQFIERDFLAKCAGRSRHWRSSISWPMPGAKATTTRT